MKTYIADSVVADSAPTATAYAAGYRTSDKLISVGPKEGTLPVVPEPAEAMRYQPLATVLEGAKLNRLFVETLEAFGDGKVAIDKTDPENPVVRIEYANKKAALPVNKNILSIDGVESELEGVVVYIPNTDKAYLPLQAVQAIKGKKDTLPSVAR